MRAGAVAVEGDVAQGFGGVADAFRRNFDLGREIGAAVAVYRDGHKVVDLWGGHRDPAREHLWRADSMVTVFSTTKGMAAIAMAVAHSRGLFDLDEPVSTYWPAFAQHGKERVTVRELMAHRAGIAVIDAPVDIAMLADADLMGDVLAAQAPQWPPGTAQGYHGQSLGWCESQILRRVDPAGRTIGRFFADEVAGPLGLDFHIGLPSTVSPDRIATLHMPSPFTALRHPRQIPFRLSAAVANPRSLTHRMLMNPKELRNLTDVTGQRVLGVEMPSTNGTGEVRAIAKAYAVMAAGGNELDLSIETLAELERPVTPERDRLLKADIAFSVGFMKPFPMLPFGSPRAFGHTGLGGSFAFADPDTGVGYAYAPNRLGVAVPTDDREQSLRAALATVAG